MKITDFLEHGRENAVRADVLAARLETTPRGLRSTPGGYGGYFLPSNDPETAQKEMAAFYHVQVARCKHGLKSVAPVARKLGIPLGQLNFESEGM